MTPRYAAADTTIIGLITYDYFHSGPENLTIITTGSALGPGMAISNTSSMGTLLNFGTIGNGLSSAVGISNLTGKSIQLIDNPGTISARTGIDNGGNVDTLQTSGVINGVSNAVINQSGGTIGTLNNSGTIFGAIGINNSGTIGTLGNSRLINAGSISAIDNAANGRIGALNNSGTLAGNVGVNNNGTIGSLDNSGTLAGGTGVFNGGSIGTLNNSGMISASSNYAIENAATGRIDVLSNSGTIVSSGGIYNNGTIGSLDNTGTLASDLGIANSGSIGTLNNRALIGTGNNYAINNSAPARIDALNNSGTLVGSVGIMNRGSVGSLHNSGTIASGTGVFNSGSIDTLNNSGLISASGTYAIDNASTGRIGLIENSGTIAGQIRNQSATALTINGGSGTTFGTLTGGAEAIGSITSTHADLSLGRGNLLLNSHVSVDGFAVNNMGVTLKVVAPITITGNYTQSAGASLISGVADNAIATGKLSDTGYGRLHVTGTTTLAAGSSVSLSKLGSYAFAPGQRFVIISTDGTATYNEQALNYSVEGYTNQVTAASMADGSQTNLVLTLDADPDTPGDNKPTNRATSRNAHAVFDGLFRYSGANIDVLNVFNPAAALGTAAADRAGAQLSPAPLLGATTQSLNAASSQIFNLAGARLDGSRAPYGGASGISTGEGSLNRAVWGQYFGGQADEDKHNEISGYRARYQGLLLGGDGQVSDRWRAGALLSASKTDVDMNDDNAGSSSKVNAYGLTAYAGYDGKPWYLNLMAGVAHLRIESERSINFPGFAGTADAKFNGTQYGAAALAGYPLALADKTTLTPLVGLAYSQVRQNGYTESGGNGAALHVDATKTNSFKSDIGFKLDHVIDTSYGELTPSMQLRWRHEFENSPLRTVASFAADTSGATGFTTFGQAPVKDTGVLVLGALLAHGNNLSISAHYTLEAGNNYQSHFGDIRLRWAF